MRFSATALAALAAIALSGCAVSFGWSYRAGGHTVFIDNESDYCVSLAVDNRETNFRFKDGRESAILRPGESATVHFRGNYHYGGESYLKINAWYPHGERAGAALLRITYDGYFHGTTWWTLKNDAFRR